MPRFESEEEFKSRRGDGFGTLPDEEYLFEVISQVEKTGIVHPQFNPNGYPSIEVSCRPIAYADDPEAEIVDTDDEPLNPEKYINFFLRPKSMGFGPAGASKSRRFVAAVLNLPVTGSLDFDWPDLIGKRVYASTILGDNGYEQIDTVRPYKSKKERTRKSRAPSLVAAAQESFGDDIEA